MKICILFIIKWLEFKTHNSCFRELFQFNFKLDIFQFNLIEIFTGRGRNNSFLKNQVFTAVFLNKVKSHRRILHDRNKFEETIRKLIHRVYPLPWWFVFVGYACAFAVVGICVYFIVLFGAALGETLVTQWIISLAIGILKSIFIIQPIKVYSFA